MCSVRNALMPLKFFKSNQGFSLVEIALVLAIMGLLAGMVIPVIGKTQNAIKHKTSTQRIEKILRVLGPHTVRAGYLPCPASSMDGISVESCADPKKQQGYVPYRTLGLPQSYALDGWGNPLRYAIAEQEKEDLLQYIEKKQRPNVCKTGFLPTLDVLDAHTKISVVTKDTDNPIAVVLVAFNEGTPGESDQEKKNLEESLTFYAGSYSNNPNSLFRHHVEWLTRDHLISGYGNTVCTRKLGKSKEDLPLNPVEKGNIEKSEENIVISPESKEDTEREEDLKDKKDPEIIIPPENTMELEKVLKFYSDNK